MANFELISLDTMANLFVTVLFIVKFRVYDHHMSCALEINSNDEFQREPVKSCSSINKNVMSPLPQCLWSLNLGWW